MRQQASSAQVLLVNVSVSTVLERAMKHVCKESLENDCSISVAANDLVAQHHRPTAPSIAAVCAIGPSAKAAIEWNSTRKHPR